MRNSTANTIANVQQMQAVVLCGGLGTRMKHRLGQFPKVLAPVGGRPFLDYVLADLRAAGCREVLLCTGYAGDTIRERYGSSKLGLSIEYSQETEPLGTGGALRQARHLIRSNPFAFLNGDSLLELDYAKLLARHECSTAIVTLALTMVPDGSRYGNVRVGSSGEILEFTEKPDRLAADTTLGKALICGGVSLLSTGIFDELPPAVSPLSFESEVLPKLIGRGLFGQIFPGLFIDIGVPEDYDRACHELQRRCGVATSHSS